MRLSVGLNENNVVYFSTRRRNGLDGYNIRWSESKRSVLHSEDMELKELLRDLEGT